MRARSAFAALAAAVILMPAGIAQATGATASPPDDQFQKVTLNDHPGEPIDLAVLPDSRVLHTTRAGVVWLHDPKTGLNTVAAELDVYQHDEEGLQSIALSPGFGTSSKKDDWVYLYYSPPLDTPIDDPATPDVNEGDAPFTGTSADFEPFKGLIRLSRFRLTGATLDLRTEQRVLDVPVDRGICCHVGGDIVFDAQGHLYLSTGDDTNPFFSDGYTPIDERADRNPAFDAQRSSGNTNDLRGKVLRIKVGSNGSYTIPRGNLFRPGTKDTRPEIYAMGLRNPFRIELNRSTGELYAADYSPDANAANPQRGPAGTGKWMTIRKAGNYGWPYCATAQLPYRDHDFATGASGEPFNGISTPTAGVDSRRAEASHIFTENGLYNATLKVTDSRGRSAATSVRIVIGNAPPVVELVRPTTGDPFAFGDVVEFEVRVTDDQPVDCSRVTVDYILGHDEHGHGQSTARGCTGSIQTTVPSGHDPDTDDLTGVFVATYTDSGTDSGEGGLPPLTGTARVVLDPTP